MSASDDASCTLDDTSKYRLLCSFYRFRWDSVTRANYKVRRVFWSTVEFPVTELIEFSGNAHLFFWLLFYISKRMLTFFNFIYGFHIFSIAKSLLTHSATLSHILFVTRIIRVLQRHNRIEITRYAKFIVTSQHLKRW